MHRYSCDGEQARGGATVKLPQFNTCPRQGQGKTGPQYGPWLGGIPEVRQSSNYKGAETMNPGKGVTSWRKIKKQAEIMFSVEWSVEKGSSLTACCLLIEQQCSTILSIALVFF